MKKLLVISFLSLGLSFAYAQESIPATPITPAAKCEKACKKDCGDKCACNKSEDGKKCCKKDDSKKCCDKKSAKKACSKDA